MRRPGMSALRRRGLAAVCALVLLISAGAVPAAAATESELKNQLANLEKQEKNLKKELSGVQSSLSDTQKEKALIDAQIENVEKQLALLDGQLTDLNQRIAAADKAIAASQAAIGEKETAMRDTQQKLGQRLRAIMKSGNVTTLQMLMSTDNYTDYLIKSKAMQCIAQRDQAAIDELEAALLDLQAEKDKLQEQKTALTADKAEVQALKAKSDAKKKDLDTLCAAAQTAVRKLQSSVAGYNDELKKIQEQKEAANREIERLVNNAGSVGTYDGRLMYWPVPTVRALSDVFGPRWGTIHRGIDIANGPIRIYGENIVAAADGEVIAVNYTNTWGSGWSSGYGYCCLIDHGKDSQGRTVTTLYAHCSEMFARVGDKVVGGKTVLAKAGRTGNVTGPHLHFEVRLDGKAVDPLYTYVDPKKN